MTTATTTTITMTTMMMTEKTNKMMLSLIGIGRIVRGIDERPGGMYNVMVGTIAYKIK